MPMAMKIRKLCNISLVKNNIKINEPSLYQLVHVLEKKQVGTRKTKYIQMLLYAKQKKIYWFFKLQLIKPYKKIYSFKYINIYGQCI